MTDSREYNIIRRAKVGEPQDRFPIRINNNKCKGEPHINGTQLLLPWIVANRKTKFSTISQYYPKLTEQLWEDATRTVNGIIEAHELSKIR
jgi:uncharacterized protein (DUF433 family)